MADIWAKEEIATMRRLYAKGLTSSAIADALNQDRLESERRYSRNAVIGMIHRLGWNKGGSTPVKRRNVSNMVTATPKTARAIAAAHDKKARKPEITIVPVAATQEAQQVEVRMDCAQPLPEMPIEPPTDGKRAPCLLTELRGDSCRFPTWPTYAPSSYSPKLFCNAVAEGFSPYCSKHRTVCCGAGTADERAAMKGIMA